MPTITIKRQRLFEGYGKLIPFGWLYSAEIDGQEFLAGHDRLATITRMAKQKYPKTPIVRAWEVK